MFTQEVVFAAQEKGLPATAHKLRHGLSLGRVPEPPRDRLGNRVFGRAHLAAFEAYLQNPPKPGRRRRVIGGPGQ